MTLLVFKKEKDIVKREDKKWMSTSSATTEVTTTHVDRIRGQRCGDIDLAAYLPDAAGPTVNIVMDLRVAHERWGSSSNPLLEAIGAPSILRLIRSAATLARTLPTLDLSCEENTARR